MARRNANRVLLHGLLLALIGGGLNGCVALRPQNPQQAECLTLFRQLDRATDAAGCRNAAYHRAADFPWLRSSRFWSALGPPPAGERRDFWLAQLERLDAESRSAEAACLAPATPPASEQLATCRDTLRPLARSVPERLTEELQVPDDYSLLSRTLGLYPLTSLAVDWGAHNAYADRREWFRRDLREFSGAGVWRTLGPEPHTALAPDELEALLRQATTNPLAVPLPDAVTLQRLAQHFAPVFIQQLGGDRDRIGAPTWQNGRIGIDAAAPSVYFYADHLLDRGTPRLRLNYVTWYPERDGDKVPLIERGALDGITVGITLDSDGTILAAEVMNNCGCYHMFFPGPGLGPQRSFPWSVDPLVPQALPALPAGEHLGIYLIAGWHQAVRAAAVPAPAEHYLLRPYAELERLPRADGTVRSLFDPAGVVAESVRPYERILFYAMGIERVGAMRQRGHQPITLVGREHYDEPDLLQRNFLSP